jgi:hypothetical protein
VRKFFIVGCQRSGTTLLRLVLESHPRVFCYDEGKAYRALKYKETPNSNNIDLIGYKIPRWTEQLDFDWAYDAGHGTWAQRFYDNEPVIFMIRDVRDVVASMMSLKYAAKSWWEGWGVERLLLHLGSQTVRNFFCEEIKKLGEVRENLCGAASLYWKFKVHAFFNYSLLGWPVLPVLYEKLVGEPEKEIRRIITFLGLPWDNAVLAHWQQSHSEVDADGKAVGQTNPARPIDSESIGRWRTVLRGDEVEAIESISGGLNNSLQNENFTHPKARLFPFDLYAQDRLEIVLNTLVAKEAIVEQARYERLGLVD